MTVRYEPLPNEPSTLGSMTARLTKRLTMTGIQVVVKNHAPLGPGANEDVHGERGQIGVGSQAAILSLLSASFERGDGANPARLRQGDDIDAWDAAKQQYGSYEAVREVLDGLPARAGGEALRASEVPDRALPNPTKVQAERARLAKLKAEGYNFILHGVGEDGERYSRPVASDADAKSAGGRYLLADGVESVGQVTRERI